MMSAVEQGLGALGRARVATEGAARAVHMVHQGTRVRPHP